MSASFPPTQAVIFDLDGTLLDTLEDLADSANAMLAKRDYPAIPTEDFKQLIGDGMAKLVERAMPESAKPTEAELDAALEEFQHEYSQRWNHKTTIYPGILDLLDQLVERNIPLGVLSNKRHEFTRKCVEEYFPVYPFGSVLGQRKGIKKKPDPAGAFDAAEELKVAPENCLYIGDSGVDMHTAVRAGMSPVGVLWGFRDAAELRGMGADHLIEKPIDLLDIL
jgi:phosphoglycolate phosphatase